MKFRNLTADEIEIRAQNVSEKGAVMLLYKNARCDMNILDETVGAENWQREHYECKGNLYCRIGINTNYENPEKGDRWVWKADCGTESNTEAVKGESSDAEKRACVNWGIGRELYTAPFIYLYSSVVVIDKNYKGKLEVQDHLKVSAIDTTEDKKIVGLEIVSEDTGRVVYSFGTLKKKGNATEKKAEKPFTEHKPTNSIAPQLATLKGQLEEFASMRRATPEKAEKALLEALKLKSMADINEDNIGMALLTVKEWIMKASK